MLTFLFWKTTINVSKLPWCNRSSLTRWRCYGAPSPGIVGCFALYTRNLLLNTIIAHSIKQNPWHSKGIHPLTLKCTIWTDSEDMIRSINQLHYITSDQSHSVKLRRSSLLLNRSGCFLEFVRTVSLKLMSSRTCYDKHICFKLSLIILIIGLNSQQRRHEGAVLDKNKA